MGGGGRQLVERQGHEPVTRPGSRSEATSAGRRRLACGFAVGASLVGPNVGQNPRTPGPTVYVTLSKKRGSLQFLTLVEASEGRGL